MGCDIHAFVEIKHGGKWLCAGTCEFQRNYDVFAKLANVRNRGEINGFDPKGLPNDISEVVSINNEFWNVDGHSHSYVSGSDLKEFLIWFREHLEEYNKVYPDFKRYIWEELSVLIQYYCTHGYEIEEYWKDNGVEDIRIVFWFDN